MLRARAVNPHADRAVPFRLLGGPTLLVRGVEGVRFFYDTSKMERQGAMPTFIKAPLFGSAPVHGLDDEHRHRKALFIEAIRPEPVRRLADAVADQWGRRLTPCREVTVFDEAVQAYGHAVLTWAGVEAPDNELTTASRDLALIVEDFGTLGLPWLQAMAARRRTGRWATELIERVRRGDLTPTQGTARARADMEFEGHPVREGQRVLIDVLGTNTDPAHWERADTFDPERFLDRPDLEHAEFFVPQGGGSAETGHRCPGEPISVELLTVTAQALASREWDVPDQDLSYRVDRLPTRPTSGVRLRLR